jgi:hypothetical protein
MRRARTVNVDPEAVYRVLVEDCAASADERDGFTRLWPDCVEWRFRGNQGQGGKVWFVHDSVYVTCYSEDDNAERAAARARANSRLAELVAASPRQE